MSYITTDLTEIITTGRVAVHEMSRNSIQSIGVRGHPRTTPLTRSQNLKRKELKNNPIRSIINRYNYLGADRTRGWYCGISTWVYLK
jgi:hypothetical protein